MDDLAISSEKRAKALVQNAEMDATIIIKDAKMKAEQVAIESAELTKSFESFKREYKSMLDRYLQDFENIASSIDIDRLAALLKEKEETTTVEAPFENKVEKDLTVEETVMKDAETSNLDDKKTMINIKYE